MSDQATAAKKKSPPRTVWSGFREGRQQIEVSAHVRNVLAEAHTYVNQIAAYGDDDAKAIVDSFTKLATRYSQVEEK